MSSSSSKKHDVQPLKHYRVLGRSGLRVSPLCLGTMTWGQEWEGWGIAGERDDAEAIFNAYCDSGGNFIDTASNYQNGTSEQWLGDFMEKRENRSELVISTKFSSRLNPNTPVNDVGNSRSCIRKSVKRSLQSLKTDYIDLLYMHYWDFSTPAEEVMSTLHSLVQEGKVLYIGISDTPAWVVAKMQMIAHTRGWTSFVAYQGQYNCCMRDLEHEIIPCCNAFGIGQVPWGVVGGGLLSGKHRRSGSEEGTLRKPGDVSEQKWRVVEEVSCIAREASVSAAQVAIAWSLSRPSVDSALIGCRVLEQLHDNLDALSCPLSEEHLERLDKVGAPTHIFPHSMIGHTAKENFTKPWFGTDNYAIDFK